MSKPTSELDQLADLYGIELSYEDVRKNVVHASAESLLAALKVLGADIQSPSDAPRVLKQRQQEIAQRGLEPVIVAWDGKATRFTLTLPKDQADAQLSYKLRTEAGEETTGSLQGRRAASKTKAASPLPSGFVQLELQSPGPLELGYHQLRIETPTKHYETWIIAAPLQAASQKSSAAPKWGCFLPLYAMKSERNWGAGDFTDLSQLNTWVHQQGGNLVGTLPILAAYLDEPFEPSPYSPASRLFWNEFYIDITRVPELKDCEPARKLINTPEFQNALQEVRAKDQVDYHHIMQLKRQVLEQLTLHLVSKKSLRYDEFMQFTQNHPHLREYAAFRATYEQRKVPWWDWPKPLCDGQLAAGDYDQNVAAYHCYVQWIAHEELRGMADQAVTAGDGLYLDLPLGVRADSYDVWRNQQAYVINSSAGAPPDAFFTKGQDWGFPPMHPEGMRQDGYRHVREYLAHHMHLASTLRIDHVMGLHRLYWVPRGMKASEGVYVRYFPEELYAVVCLESQRHHTTIIGENLGTVPPGVNEMMEEHDLRRMFVVQYELHPEAEDIVKEVPREVIASINTHDMPMFAAWVNGLDLPLRIELGLLTEEEAEEESQKQQALKAKFQKWLQKQKWMPAKETSDQAMLNAILRWLAASDAEAMLVNLEDLWLETKPQNVPGTGPELPNWKRKAARDFEEFTRDEKLLAFLSSINELRKKKVGKTPPTPVKESP